MWDAHCHETDPAEYELARSVGVTGWLWAGIEPDQWRQAPSDVRVCWGIHPWPVLEPDFDADRALQALRNQLQARRPAAVGEIGLDFHRARTPEQRELGLKVFQAQLELAADFDLPVVIHAVKCHPEVLGLLKKIQFARSLGRSLGSGKRLETGSNKRSQGFRGIIHSFKGPQQFIEPYEELGFVLSLGPHSLGKLKTLPQTFVIETDAPARAARLRDLAEVAEVAARRSDRTLEELVEMSDALLEELIEG